MLTVFMFIYIVIRTYLHTVFVIYTSPKLTANAPEHFVWLSNTIKPPFLGICPFFRGRTVGYVSFREGRPWFLPRGHDLRVARWRCRYEKPRVGFLPGIRKRGLPDWKNPTPTQTPPPCFNHKLFDGMNFWWKSSSFFLVKVMFFLIHQCFSLPDCHQVIL